MDVGSIFVTLAIAIIVVGYIARPLIENRGYAFSETDRRSSTLQAQRDQILTVLQELDMDHAMGKIPDADYTEQRSVLVSRGAEVLRELDLLSGVTSQIGGGATPTDLANKTLEDQIERAVSRLRNRGEEIEANFCSKCGNELQSGDRFCPHCGAATSASEVR